MINEIIISIGITLMGIGILGTILNAVITDIYDRVSFTVKFLCIVFLFGIALIFTGCFI